MLERKNDPQAQDGSAQVIQTVTSYGSSYGDNNTIGAFAVGSILPGGRFVVNSPDYIQSTSRQDRTVMLPDKTGTHLRYNDGATDYSDEIANALDKSGKFRFVGVTRYAGNVCKNDCNDKAACCPIGYTDEQSRFNFFPVLSAAEIATTGFVSVYTEREITPNDDVFVRVKVTDKDAVPCQLLGGVTSKSDAGTQPVGSNVRVEKGAIAGSSVILQLGGMSQV